MNLSGRNHGRTGRLPVTAHGRPQKVRKFVQDGNNKNRLSNLESNEIKPFVQTQKVSAGILDFA